MSGQVNSGHVRSASVRTREVRNFEVRTGQVRTGQVDLGIVFIFKSFDPKCTLKWSLTLVFAQLLYTIFVTNDPFSYSMYGCTDVKSGFRIF